MQIKHNQLKAFTCTINCCRLLLVFAFASVLINSTLLSAVKAQSSYGYINQPNSHPFSPDFIARTGQRVAEQMRSRASQSNNNLILESSIQAALISGGAAGVDQGAHGDCWFESALAALARIPAGQQVIANMIIQRPDSSYLVYFPGVKQPMPVSQSEIAQQKTRDLALWASIVEAAAIKGWPNLVTEGRQQLSPYGHKPLVIMGLHVLTGNKVQCIDLSKVSTMKVGNFIARSLNNNTPMTAATYGEKLSRGPQVVVPSHAYTVIACDSQTITLRNPWGRNSTPNNKIRLPQLPQVGQEVAGVYDMGGGLIKMTLFTFRQHYHYLAWAPVMP